MYSLYGEAGFINFATSQENFYSMNNTVYQNGKITGNATYRRIDKKGDSGKSRVFSIITKGIMLNKQGE
jgi:hypothetical protein